ncbi:PilZ domain-containing protein [Spirochaeta africana]|uniref:PilZ domain-containing protein n=1 Tax=Spirochaeta africana (strain ATCC 700263 / DSM 8902 / Z-7692) TaxID=889378 RepID=H9UHN3_SPIAZ|nr:PilZ domain-containing protein [Spirochaeta africana]AFG37026.1 PilZ domain-containing protein [Spirochaeta africana DSM 8902]
MGTSGLPEWAVISPLELFLFLGITGLIVGGLSWYSYTRRQQQQAARLQRARRTFQRLIDQYGLISDERAVVEVLARYLREPEKAYLLLENQALFDACVDQAKSDRVLSEDAAAEVRLKLRFGPKRAGNRALSSVELANGTAVVMKQIPRPAAHGQHRSGQRPGGGHRKGHHDAHRHAGEPHAGRHRVGTHQLVIGRVLKSGASGLRIHTDSGGRPFPPHARILVMYHDASGAYEFETEVLSWADSVLLLKHADRPSPLQQRASFRKRVYLPTYVKRAGSTEPAGLTHFMDLSCTGAAIMNPERRFKAGDHVVLKFHPDSFDYLSVLGKVVRTSRKNSVAHISFENLQPTVQKRLYGYIFRR